MNPKIIDNFLEDDYFKKLSKLVFSRTFPWYKCDINTFDTRKYFTHILFEKSEPSFLFENFSKLIDVLEIRALIRVKLNYYPSNDKIIKHAYHRDYKFSHKAAILSLNTCDGGTYINEKFYPSVKNKIILFDGNQEHCSTNTTDEMGRCNININYF